MCSVYVNQCSYFSIHSQVIGPNSMTFVRNMITKLQEQQTNILRFIACSEIFLMPAIVFMTFRLVLIGIFWQFCNLNCTCLTIDHICYVLSMSVKQLSKVKLFIFQFLAFKLEGRVFSVKTSRMFKSISVGSVQYSIHLCTIDFSL